MTSSVLHRKLKRLAAMDAAELAYRLRERTRLELERAATRLRDPADLEERFLDRLPATADGSVLGFLRHQAAPRFYLPADAGGRRKLANLFCHAVPGVLPVIRSEADRLADHRVELLGFGEVDCGDPIDWHRDPVTGARWEPRFWADYDLVGTPPDEDPKRIHELARHQHLPRLAKAWLLLGEERHAREAVRQMLGWIGQNPPGLGIHWHSSLEIALRTVSWLWTLFFLLPSRALDETAARRIGASLFAQLDHVLAYPSLYSSPNTHLLGEATALFLGGAVFSGCDGAGAWRDRGAELLVAGLDDQVLPDGFHAELSTSYHAYALDFGLQALALAERNGFELPARTRHRIEAMAEPLLHLLQPDGSLPMLGDDDGGRAVALAETSYAAPLDLMATAAVLFGRGDFKARAGALREETVWLLGPGVRNDWDRLPAAEPTSLRASFPEGGYWVQRSGWDPLAGHAVFDCGDLGRPTGGHGHADALSLTLSAVGRSFLVDPGTYVYNGRAAWRDAFRSTRAHNTVVVDGRDQSEPGGTFSWERRARARILEDHRFDDLDLVAGEHDGYAVPEGGVIHRRRLLHVRGAYWLVLDDFRAVIPEQENGTEHAFEILWHLAPDVAVEGGALPRNGTGDRATHLDLRSGPAGLRLFLHTTAPVEARLEQGEEDPAGPLGWVSPRYGDRRPAPTLSARFRSALPAAVVTVLAPSPALTGREAWSWRPRAIPVHTGSTEPGDPVRALAVAVDHPGAPEDPAAGTDLAVLAPGAPELETAALGTSCRMRGEAFFARLDGLDRPVGAGDRGRLQQLLAIGATRFSAGGVPVLRSERPVTTHRGDIPGAELPPAPTLEPRLAGGEPCAE